MKHALQIILLLTISLPTKADVTSMEFENINGLKEPISNYIGKGRWVLVNTWSPSCSACIIELPQIKKFIARNPNIPVLGITLDFPSFTYGKIDIVKDFIKRNPLDYPLLLADMEKTSDLIGRRLVGIPSVTIFHPDGRSLVTWPGVVEIDEIENFIRNFKEEDDPLSDSFD